MHGWGGPRGGVGGEGCTWHYVYLDLVDPTIRAGSRVDGHCRGGPRASRRGFAGQCAPGSGPCPTRPCLIIEGKYYHKSKQGHGACGACRPLRIGRLEGGRLRPSAYSVVCRRRCRRRPPGWVAGVGAAPGVITMVVNNN